MTQTKFWALERVEERYDGYHAWEDRSIDESYGLFLTEEDAKKFLEDNKLSRESQKQELREQYDKQVSDWNEKHADDVQEGRGDAAQIARPIDEGRGGDDPVEQRNGDEGSEDGHCRIGVVVVSVPAVAQPARHSISIVPGGLEVTSYMTRLTPCTSLIIRVAVSDRKSWVKG